MVEEITTTRQFTAMKNRGRGYVMISDDATGDKIHTVLCDEVESPDFYEKVTANRSKHGKFFWSNDVLELSRSFPKARSCGICKA